VFETRDFLYFIKKIKSRYAKKGEKRMQIYEELKARGLIAQVTDEPQIRELINNGGAKFYIGFDPTADSLHVGHFMALCLMKRLQMAGNKPVVLLGGGTGFIGDPSGRTDMRAMMNAETIQHNCECFKKQMERFIDFGEGKAVAVNNADWLLNLKYIDMLRDVGVCFSVNNMLRAECYKQRMERGLSFFELNYMIMQAYDFLHLHNEYGCNMQFGGDDQWSNMLAGTDLIRRKTGQDAYAMTITLLMNSEGKKMGKTAKGAVWLDPEKTSPFEFYQYWRNTDDKDVMKCLRMLTFISLEELAEIEKWEDSRINEKKELLAYELTKLVHGEAEAQKAKEASRALFAGAGDDSNMPTTEISEQALENGGILLPELMVACGLAASKTEARRLIQQGGVSVNEEKADSIGRVITAQELQKGVKLRRGKKVFRRAVLKS
jgi:tyrosine--tRNA ligase